MIRLVKSSHLKSEKGEGGQATLEFVLMMIIVVAVILGGVYQLNDAFKNYLDQYFGNYLVCLIETGELPTLSGGGGSQCTKNAFSLSSGKPLEGEALSGDGSGGGGDGDGSGDASSRADRRRRSTSRGNAESSGRSNGGGGFGRVSTQTVSSGSGGSSDGEELESDAYTGSSASSSDGTRLGNVGSRRSGRVSSIGYVEEFDDGKRKDKGKKQKDKEVKNKRAEKQRSERSKKISFTPPPPKPKIKDEGRTSGFEFSKYIKWLIILAIIVAIVVFVGGQALNITKSWEKG